MTSSVRSLGGQRFKAAFTPHQALPHRVDIRFNGETVPGKCLFICLQLRQKKNRVKGVFLFLYDRFATIFFCNYLFRKYLLRNSLRFLT